MFESNASNLVAGDGNGARDVFLPDLVAGTTTRVSVDSSGVEGNGASQNSSISADGRYVAFESTATNLVPNDTNGAADVFVHDNLTGETTRVSLGALGVQGDGDSLLAAISPSGHMVGFSSLATNLVAGDTNGWTDVFVKDLATQRTTRVSVTTNGAQSGSQSALPSITADGRRITFYCYAPLVAGDTNGVTDIYVRDDDATAFTRLCNRGVGGVSDCPCSNPAGGPGRGCDNSAATGGASLTASGIAYLSMDSLVFTTSGEKPTATSVLLQGTTSPPSGAVYGQGVRCVGGALKRLFTKTAVGGSITAPDFIVAGDPTVSARSAAKGSPISAGQSRWYLVFYRAPIVLGGCPAGSTFNATQTGRIDWSL